MAGKGERCRPRYLGRIFVGWRLGAGGRGCSPSARKFGARFGGGSLVVSPKATLPLWCRSGLDDTPAAPLALPGAALCVLPLVVRAAFASPKALAPTSVDSIFHYIFYLAILYRSTDENVMKIKSTKVGYTPGSSCPLGALTHPPPSRLFCGGCFPYPPHPLGVFFIV